MAVEEQEIYWTIEMLFSFISYLKLSFKSFQVVRSRMNAIFKKRNDLFEPLAIN